MPMTLAELLALFPDNTSGLIGPDDMRTVTTELYNKPVVVVGPLLATKVYNPGTDTGPATTSSAYADVDAANLAVTFTVPASGQVVVVLTASSSITGSSGMGWGLRSAGSNVTGSTAQIWSNGTTLQSGSRVSHRALITGLTPAASLTYTWSHARTSGSGTGYTYYGGTSGEALMEIWSA